MIDKTEALVLRIVPFSRTSHIVTWLTPQHGKLSTIIKGACRPRSPFLGQYDLFYTCELLFYTRERNNLHIARECAPISTRTALRNDWRASVCASYMCDLTARISMRGGNQRELYEVASSALDFLCEDGIRPQFLFWFELRLAKVLGLAPQLMKCPSCGRALPCRPPARDGRTGSGSLLFSCSRGGILCRECAEHHDASAHSTDPVRAKPRRPAGKGEDTVSISPAILAMMRSWQNAMSPRAAQNTRCTTEQLLVFRKLLGIFLSYHLDIIMPISRKTAMDMVMS